LAKIAIELEEALARRRLEGKPGSTTPRIIARGDGWTVADVICTCGAQDRPYEERHSRYAIATVLSGSFNYRSALGRDLMTPGSLMLGNEGDDFECSHEHAEGDRCVALWYEPDYFEQLAVDVGMSAVNARFRVPRLPQLRPLSPLVARIGAGASNHGKLPWEELALRLGASCLSLAMRLSPDRRGVPLNAEARIIPAIQMIDRHADEDLALRRLARSADLSPYHFLRTFERVTGLTPHQYVRRARIRAAATRLVAEDGKVVDIALDCGFGDVSNFNRAFRTEFGVSPRAFRRTSALHLPGCLQHKRYPART
jgi:AraC-like DNA-binding protein